MFETFAKSIPTTLINYIQCVFDRIIKMLSISYRPVFLKQQNLLYFQGVFFFFKIYPLSREVLSKIVVPIIYH